MVPVTLLGAAVVGAGPGVGRVLGVPGGRAVSRPIKVLRLVLGEQAEGVVLEPAVELSCSARDAQ